MTSPRQLARSQLARVIARVTTLALVAGSLSADARASVPASPAALESHALPDLPVRVSTPAEEVLACVVAFVGVDPSGLTKSAFGELLSHTGSDPQPYAFTGEPYDPNVGFQWPLSWPAAAAAHRDPRGPQVCARRLAPNARPFLDVTQRPAQAAENQNLVPLVVAQDVAHPGAETCAFCTCQRLNRYSWWPVFRCPSVAGFGCPPRLAQEKGPSRPRTNSPTSSSDTWNGRKTGAGVTLSAFGALDGGDADSTRLSRRLLDRIVPCSVSTRTR